MSDILSASRCLQHLPGAAAPAIVCMSDNMHHTLLLSTRQSKKAPCFPAASG